MKERQIYISPQSEVIELRMQGMLAASQPKVAPKFINPFTNGSGNPIAEEMLTW